MGIGLNTKGRYWYVISKNKIAEHEYKLRAKPSSQITICNKIDRSTFKRQESYQC